MKTETLIRQGDVLLVRLDKLDTKGLTPLPAENGRYVLARGEATGHHHSVEARASTALLAGPNAEMFLMIKEGTALLEHQEHGPLTLAPGPYRVVRQREYAPGAIRNVMD